MLATSQVPLIGVFDVDPSVICRWYACPPRVAIEQWLADDTASCYAQRSRIQYVSMLCAAATWLGQERNGMTYLTVERDDLRAFLSSRTRKPCRTGKDPIDRIWKKVGERWRDDVGAGARTQRRYIALFTRLLAHLVALGLRRTNPAAELLGDSVSPRRAIPKYLSDGKDTEYINWVLAQPVRAWYDIRARALRLILLASGITVAEAQRLKVSDIRLPSIAAPGHWSTVEGVQPIAWIEVAGHRRAAAHRTPLARWAIGAIEEWLVERLLVLDNAGISSEDGLVFPGIDGTAPGFRVLRPMDSATIFVFVRDGIEQLCGPGAARKGPQTLRNTFAARNLLGGRKPEDIQQWMGLKTDFTILALRQQIDQCCADEPI